VEERTAGVSEERLERATNLLDVHKIIGGPLGIYGAILLVAGIVASDADKEKAAGVNVNLWVGIGLLLACAVFWAWALIRPLSEVLSESGER
jgi:drug/metabolite transporter (DMT)-like permease